MNTLKLPLVVCLLALAAVSGGCGYTMKSQYREDVRTVSVPIFTRGASVYRRDLENQLTEAIVKRIELDTPYKVVSKGRADTELRGQIRQISQRVLSKNPDSGRAREMEETFYVDYVWKDLRTGKDLVAHHNFRVSGTYIPESPLGENFEMGSQDVINRLAVRIVESMASDWPEEEEGDDAQ